MSDLSCLEDDFDGEVGSEDLRAGGDRCRFCLLVEEDGEDECRGDLEDMLLDFGE